MTKFPEKFHDEIRHKILAISSKYLKKPTHISEVEKIIAKGLKLTRQFINNNKDLLITEADKGNITVVLKRQDYLEKMKILLDDSATYEKIDSDPLLKSQKTIFNKLDGWRKSNLLGEKIQRKDIITTNTNLSRMYGLPKVHKENWPLRRVVSYTNTPSYFMAKYFDNILKSVPNTFCNIKNSLEFISKIKNKKIPYNHTMVSLDVNSLFTNVPLDLFITSIEKIWHYISPNTKLPLDQFIFGIKLLMEQTFFQFDHQFYIQPLVLQWVLQFLLLPQILLCKI